SELYRRTHREEDARLARASIAALRAAPQHFPGQEALFAYLNGILAINDDRAAGQRALRDAIARTGTNTTEYDFKVRAYSYSILALDAAKASEFGNMLSILADTLGVPRPERCALALAVQDEQIAVAFADAAGQTGGTYTATRASLELDVAGLVPSTTVERLRGCERVAVLTRAPVLGSGGLLPRDLAWSYTLPRSTPARPAATGKRVVVANPLPPTDLKLPPLGPLPEESSATTTVLRGADATPSRVLQTIRDASVVEFHTHGFIANDVSEASYLVLSPEVDGHYAMTARDVVQAKLDAAPLVILGACHAATSSRSLEGGIGLAEAFLRAGARAVVASPDAVPDLGAQAFFAAVRDRVTHGADPAVAVRDERARLLAASPDHAWIAGIVVFE
ncbi:MAG: CHAT domain-containing protein, partial [bacterium]